MTDTTATKKPKAEPPDPAEIEASEREALAAVEEALDEAEAGVPSVPHKEVKQWLRSWGTPNELPPPIPRPDDQ